MAVIVTQKVNFGSVRVFLPKGKLSKTERLKAEKLDKFLKDRVPTIEKEMDQEGSLDEEALKKWHSLGLRLQFVDDRELVDPLDVDEGRIWLALREYCPNTLLPKGERDEELEKHDLTKREGKKYDHFELCYKLGKYRWSEISWLPTWTEWVDLIEAPGLVRDERIILEVAKCVKELEYTVAKEKFREIIKELRKEFPTKEKVIDSTGFNASVITKKVKEAFHRALSGSN